MPPRERDSSHRPRKTGARPSSARSKRADSGAPADSSADHAPNTNTPSEAVTAFLATQPFPLDPFQIEAVEHLAAGRSVLVAAPTGTGKTIVAECAIWLARASWAARDLYRAGQGALEPEISRPARAPRRRARWACSPATSSRIPPRRSSS